MSNSQDKFEEWLMVFAVEVNYKQVPAPPYVKELAACYRAVAATKDRAHRAHAFPRLRRLEAAKP
jgi:hypothetical protein